MVVQDKLAEVMAAMAPLLLAVEAAVEAADGTLMCQLQEEVAAVQV